MATDTPPSRPGRKPGTTKLDDLERGALLRRLRDGTGPVNLTAEATRAGISKPTLLSYIAAEPGLAEAIEARRKQFGRGYVQVKRGTKATRKAAQERQRTALPQPKRDRLPEGPAARVLARVWRESAKADAWAVERAEADADSLHDVLVARSHLLYTQAHADVFEALVAGTMRAEEARATLDALPEPLPRYTPRTVTAAAALPWNDPARRDRLAAEFKATYGYLPSRRKLDELMGVPPRSFAPGEWDEGKDIRDINAALKAAAKRAKPRKSYASRPKDAQGRPLVARGVMAKLQREAEARGLTGQAAKDAATAAALATLTTDGATSGSVVNSEKDGNDD